MIFKCLVIKLNKESLDGVFDKIWYMNFSSVNFLFLFLPVLLPVLFLGGAKNRIKYKNIILIIFSFVFYFAGEKAFTLLLLFSALFNFLISKKLNGARAKKVLWCGIILNIGILGVFKYLNFFIDQINAFLLTFGPAFSQIPHSNIHLPVGISFFTFQAVSYIIDIYKKDVKPANFLDFTLYLTLFPQLVAGPIVRYVEIKDQIKNRTVNWQDFSEGLQRFISGLGKKVIIADTLSYTVDKIFAINALELTAPVAILGALCYTLQIFFDFSGYSDMAIGLGKMFGFKFPENFNYPYISKSIKEFWRRWHITLSRWFKDYVYIPLGGSRSGQTFVNIFIVFMLTGLWHGASWNFIIWGMYNGILIILERAFLLKVFKNLPKAMAHIYFIPAVLIGWVIFRSRDLTYAIHYIKAMIFNSGSFSSAGEYLNYELIFTIIIGIFLSLPIIKRFESKIPAWLKTGFYIVLLIVSGAYISSNTYQPFIYFRF